MPLQPFKATVPQDGKSWWLRLGKENLPDKFIFTLLLDMQPEHFLHRMQDVQILSQFGEYTVYSGVFEGERLGLLYHGSGSFSVSTAIDELAMLGAKAILRVGNSGGKLPVEGLRRSGIAYSDNYGFRRKPSRCAVGTVAVLLRDLQDTLPCLRTDDGISLVCPCHGLYRNPGKLCNFLDICHFRRPPSAFFMYCIIVYNIIRVLSTKILRTEYHAGAAQPKSTASLPCGEKSRCFFSKQIINKISIESGNTAGFQIGFI